MTRIKFFIPLAFLVFLAANFAFTPVAYADSIGLLFRGVAKTVGAVFQVPASMLAGSTQAFPLGLIGGAVGGSMKAVAGTISGAADIARGAAPYAKYMVFFM